MTQIILIDEIGRSSNKCFVEFHQSALNDGEINLLVTALLAFPRYRQQVFKSVMRWQSPYCQNRVFNHEERTMKRTTHNSILTIFCWSSRRKGRRVQHGGHGPKTQPRKTYWYPTISETAATPPLPPHHINQFRAVSYIDAMINFWGRFWCGATFAGCLGARCKFCDDDECLLALGVSTDVRPTCAGNWIILHENSLNFMSVLKNALNC